MASKLFSKLFLAVLVVVSLFVAVIPAEAAGNNLPSFEAFVQSVSDGSHAVKGVYVPGVMAYAVVQQPASNPGYVSTKANAVTQFGMAASYGVTGLLAHNYLAGRSFSGLVGGQEVYVVYGDGTVKKYAVSAVMQYQALDPSNPSSDFVNLNGGGQISASNLFGQLYMGGNQVVFQTCIARNGNASWGRLFVVATPIN